MNQDERARVIHGQVFFKDEWIPIEEKDAHEAEFRKRVMQGYVLYEGTWITIADRIAKDKPAVVKPAKPGPTPYTGVTQPLSKDVILPKTMENLPPVIPAPFPAPEKNHTPKINTESPAAQHVPSDNLSFTNYLNTTFSKNKDTEKNL